MRRYHLRLVLFLLAFVAAFVISSPGLQAEDHVVSPAQLHHALETAASARQNNIAEIDSFFSSPPVKKALAKSRLSLRQVQSAVPTLSDQELAALAQRTTKIQNDFAAGALSNEHLTYIVIAIAAALIVILAFEA